MPRFESTILNDYFSTTASHTHDGENSTKISYNNLTDKPGYASATEAGLIKVGTNLTIDSNGVLSAIGGGSGGNEVEISENEPIEPTVDLWVDLSQNPMPSDIEVITGDTLPVGSEVDYNGTEVPVNWEEIPEEYELPDGGTKGQILAKASDENRDVEWVDNQGGGGVVSGTVPIGTILDYDGDTVPQGYAQIESDNAVLLYDGGAAAVNIALSDNVENYKKIKLICKCSTAGYEYSFESIYYPEVAKDGVHTLRTTGRVGNSYTYNVSENITFVGNRINRGTQIEDRNSGTGNERSAVVGMYIVKVIGYKNEYSSDDVIINMNENEYKLNETSTITVNNNYMGVIGGMVTTSATNLTFTIVTPKSLKNITQVTINSLRFRGRIITGGYIVVGSSAYADIITNKDSAGNDLNPAVSSYKATKTSDNTVKVEVIFASAISSTNNVPVAVEVRNVELTFN